MSRFALLRVQGALYVVLGVSLFVKKGFYAKALIWKRPRGTFTFLLLDLLIASLTVRLPA